MVQNSVSLQSEIDNQSEETYDATTKKEIPKSKLKSTTIIIIIIILFLLCIHLIRKYNIPAYRSKKDIFKMFYFSVSVMISKKDFRVQNFHWC